MKTVALLFMTLSLSACHCMLEPGDKYDASSYWNGCMAAAKRSGPSDWNP